MKFRWFILIWSFAFLGVIALVGIAGMVDPATKDAIFKEGGVVETLSAAGYFMAVALLLFQMVKQRYSKGWSLCVMLLGFGLRELDFDKRFTTMGIFKSRFYLSNEVMIGEKMIGVLISALFLVCLFFLLKTFARSFIEDIKARKGQSLTLLMALVFMVSSKSIDGLGRKLKPLGIVLSDSVRSLAGVIEESMELMIPLLFIVAIAEFSRIPRPKPESIEVAQKAL